MLGGAKVSTRGRSLPLVRPSLGVLSIHLDGTVCRVGCEFCYLGDRVAPSAEGGLAHTMLGEILARLDYAEVAVAVSEPANHAVAPLSAIARAAAARGKPLSITTTASVLATAPALLDGVSRVNLSVDPRKGSVAPKLIALAARRAKAESPGPIPREVVLIASLTTPAWAESLVGEGRLRELLELPEVDKVALNALKPPPPWCDRAFWLRTCARLAPLLKEHLDRRLFLDCYVAARILHLGGCPARPDVSPGNEFRSCVYQPAPDFRFGSAAELEEKLVEFAPPEVCPFPIP